MASMREIVQKSLIAAQVKEKSWYDQKSRTQSFESGKQVLVLTLSTTSKLPVERQGPLVVK